jgi:Restriction endonuclease
LTPKKITACLEISIGINGAPRPLQAAIERELIESFKVSAIEAAELAEKHIAQIARLIALNDQHSAVSGTLYPLTIIGTFSDIVVGSCFTLREDSPIIGQLKSQRTQADALLQQMQQLTFSQFEMFGAKILTELGADHATVTPHANDQGIDFYGELSLGKAQERPPEFFRLAHDVKIAFMGQAKHYPKTSLGPDIVRELVGAIGLARTKTFSKANLDLFETVSIKPFSPLLAMLLTTGGLTSGAIQLANEAGVIARTGQQLSVFLADKGIGMEETDAGHVFRPELFLAWLNT